MDSMSEQWWEKKLNIRTAGKVDHFIEEACNPYEPTDYCILEALADSGYISSDSHVLDYGCGKGRTAIFLSFRTGCRATGIEFDQELCEEAVKNLERCKLPGAYKKGIRFVCEDARKYEIEGENCFYFFNPFAEEVLRAVLGKIQHFEAEMAALMTADGLQFVDEIDCTELYENYDRRERILVFEMA